MQQQILDMIQKYETIIIHRHVRPDPDAYGSQAGLKAMIKAIYPEKNVYMAGDHEKSLSFLDTMDHIEDDLYKHSLIIVCDTANRDRIDDQRYDQGKYLIKIDHHPDVDKYGDISWVNTKASSTSEMVCELFKEYLKETNPNYTDGARLLFAGIVGDTGRFRFPNTTERTFYWAAELIKYTFSRDELYNELYKTSLRLTRLEGYVLSEMKLLPSGAAYVNLPIETLQKFEVTSKEAAGIVNTFSTLEGLKAWVFFVEEEDVIRVRLRSKGPEIHKLAGRYNGGGHPMASGASVNTWQDTEEVLKELDELCENYKR
ncbi:bifunctional oligoribonuclease/PAP phosphatase NrnA [Bacillus shivajii]|uniref:DHH family phosphoesterase n=1 Tax=Bacillus shivajii TaxID=1983719 RepID=UPI001CFBCB81|nr:bifunctional oligoribonuclease/PAP phosphatase NrnA [Bacillus shivajii]UCZ52268.1 bifunctional oligoribonuclease/PAP phosphatase NrnA [Bacillus shivajii]